MVDTFLMFPQNAAYLRGERLKPHASISRIIYACLMLLLIPFLAFGIYTIALTLVAFAEHWDLENYGRTTHAVIVRRNENYTEGLTTYHLRYDYTVLGSHYSDNQQVPQEAYSRYVVGQRINVLYVGHSPNVSRIVGVSDDEQRTFLVVLTLGWNVAVIIFAGCVWWSWERQSRLFKEGKVIPGEIVHIESHTDEGHYMIKIAVRFRTPTLQMRHGKRKYTSNAHKGQRLPRPGQGVSILYVDDRLWEIL